MPGDRNEAGDTHAVVLFDGVCNLCNGAVIFIIERDPTGYFQFAPLQSATGEHLLRRCGRSAQQLESIVLVQDGRCYDRSDAALRIAAGLTRPWRWLRALAIIPRPLRDWLYDQIARRRYRWFGRRDACMVPTPELRQRFLE